MEGETISGGTMGETLETKCGKNRLALGAQDSGVQAHPHLRCAAKFRTGKNAGRSIITSRQFNAACVFRAE